MRETMRMTTQYCDDNGDGDDNNNDYLAALIIILKNLETVGVVSLSVIVIIAWFSAASERHDQKSNKCDNQTTSSPSISVVITILGVSHCILPYASLWRGRTMCFLCDHAHQLVDSSLLCCSHSTLAENPSTPKRCNPRCQIVWLLSASVSSFK